MKELTVQEMMAYQEKLQAKNQVKWGEPICPETAVRKLCWAYGELAEAGDILKKQGTDAILAKPEVREHFTEELGDVMMYLFDVMLCLGISAEDFAEVYRKKCDRNVTRWDG